MVHALNNVCVAYSWMDNPKPGEAMLREGLSRALDLPTAGHRLRRELSRADAWNSFCVLRLVPIRGLATARQSR
jgi:hypothetical protein